MKNRDKKGRFILGHQVNAFTDEQMNTYFDLYCIHRASGKDKEAFSRHGCDFRTVERWAAKSIMPTIKKRLIDAEAKAHYFWETVLFNTAFGIPMHINPPTDDRSAWENLPESKYWCPRILILLIRSKFRYGYKAEVEEEKDNNGTDSNPFNVIDENAQLADIHINQSIR